MSTVKHLTELKRSWSAENLFQIQTKEEIARLKAEIKELKLMEAVIEAKDKTIADQEGLIMRFRVQIYDLTKGNEKLGKAVMKKKAIKAKKQIANKKKKAMAKTQRRGSAIEVMDENRKKQGAKHDDNMNAALAVLAKLESKEAAAATLPEDELDTDGDSMVSAEEPVVAGRIASMADAAQIATEFFVAEAVAARGEAAAAPEPAAPEPIPGDAPLPTETPGLWNPGAAVAPGATTAAEQDEPAAAAAAAAAADSEETAAPAYEFDLRELAREVPDMLLNVALDAQEKFVLADINGNGLLDVAELKQVLPAKLLGIRSPSTSPLPSITPVASDPQLELISEACAAVGIDSAEEEYDFLDSVRIIMKLKEWAYASAQISRRPSPTEGTGVPVAVYSAPDGGASEAAAPMHRFSSIESAINEKPSARRRLRKKLKPIPAATAGSGRLKAARKSQVSEACSVM